MKRTNYCGLIDTKYLGKKVTLCGWVHSRRDHGGVIFIDLRDREGLVQVVFQPERKEIFSQAERLRSEFVICIEGQVRKRPEGTINPNLFTGQIEVVVEKLDIINSSPALPFEISEYSEVSEEIRLKYRFLDLRRPQVQKNFLLRHKVLQQARSFLSKQGFLEIETPSLTKSTPEGARDFLVPSRVNTGHFYALPQSPQLFKQILMVSGFDKYFQIVKCFRDEDLRADRQPEFTQIDLEMSFVNEDDVINTIEGLLSSIYKDIFNKEIQIPFPRIPYSEAMLKYGTDKPDTRFSMEIVELTQNLKDCGFKVFNTVISKGGLVRGLCAPRAGELFSRSEIDELIQYVGKFGAKGLAWMKVTDKGPESNIVKFFNDNELKIIQEKLNAKTGDLMLFLADESSIVAEGLGALRIKLAKQLKLIPENKLNFLWVVDFPLLEWDKDEKRWAAMHHPFTSPKEEDIKFLDLQDKMKDIKARAYDIVLNGVELGGGSVRIHRKDVQEKMFNILNINSQEAKEKFGFLIDALTYGAPPHGGIALGFDRLCALILGEDSIRDVIAFPKTQKAACLMSGAPSTVSEKQLRELGIKTGAK